MSARETPEERDARLDLERRVLALGKRLGSEMPPNVGFAVFLYNFGARGALAYCANGDRDDMVELIKEFLARLERGLS
jgi:hypothetical protein